MVKRQRYHAGYFAVALTRLEIEDADRRKTGTDPSAGSQSEPPSGAGIGYENWLAALSWHERPWIVDDFRRLAGEIRCCQEKRPDLLSQYPLAPCGM